MIPFLGGLTVRVQTLGFINGWEPVTLLQLHTALCYASPHTATTPCCTSRPRRLGDFAGEARLGSAEPGESRFFCQSCVFLTTLSLSFISVS